MDSSYDDEANIYLITNHEEAEEYFRVSNDKWYLDICSSKQMTRDESLFSSFTIPREDLSLMGTTIKLK